MIALVYSSRLFSITLDQSRLLSINLDYYRLFSISFSITLDYFRLLSVIFRLFSIIIGDILMVFNYFSIILVLRHRYNAHSFIRKFCGVTSNFNFFQFAKHAKVALIEWVCFRACHVLYS